MNVKMDIILKEMFANCVIKPAVCAQIHLLIVLNAKLVII